MDKWNLDPSYGPIFGRVPEELRGYYEKNSGTFFKDDRWYINQDLLLNEDQILAWLNSGNKSKTPKPARYFQADKFQNLMGECREAIRSRLVAKNIDYNFDNKEIFTLMRDGRVKIEYEYQGFPCSEEISI